MQLLPMGPTAVLVDELDDPAGWAAEFRRREVPDVVEVVPAASTVLLVGASASSLPTIRDVALTVVGDRSVTATTLIEIDVRYDGPDLEDVAGATGLSVDEVVALHSGATYRVEFCGFAPGFGYLSGLPERLHLPRRPTPRTRVPAGSLAIAAGYTAVYPTESPGGWHLIGSTDAVLFDVARDQPATFTPGASVSFVPR